MTLHCLVLFPARAAWLLYKSAELTWQFTLKGESLNVSSLNIPNIGLPESDENLEGFVLEKIFLYDKILNFIEYIFIHFVKLRLSNRWQKKMVPEIRNWIQSA